MSLADLEKEMRSSADFVTQREIKICLNCGAPQILEKAQLSCLDCGSYEHTKTLLIVATWKDLPPHLADGRAGPGVRVTNIGGNAV